jgi:hypothetical protein
MVVHVGNPSYAWGRVGGSGSEVSSSKKHMTLSGKWPKQKRAEGIAILVECMPSKHKTPSLNPWITKKKKEFLVFNPSDLWFFLKCQATLLQNNESHS